MDRVSLRRRLQARRTWRTLVIVAVAVLVGAIAAGFARLCDGAMRLHTQVYHWAPWASLLLLPLGFAVAQAREPRRNGPAAQ